MAQDAAHRVTLTETNRRAWTWYCGCGEIGTVHGPLIYRNEKTKRDTYAVEEMQRAARDEHGRHVEAVQAADGARAFDELTTRATLNGRLHATLHRPGRSGRG